MSEVPDLAYGTNPGCVARVSDGRTPHQCRGEEAFAVPHTFEYPRRRRVRLYVCQVHGEQHPAAEPLTNRDRAIIAARRADQAAARRRADGRTHNPGPG